MDLGAVIRYFRKLRDMDQKDLAEKLNVSNKTVSSWESNRTQPKMDMIEAMCDVFQCQKSDFLEAKIPVDYVATTPAGQLIIEETYYSSSPSIVEKIDNFIVLYPHFMGAAIKCTPEQINMITAVLEELAKLNKEK